MKERYHISGMTCSACSSHVEKAVNKLAGIEKASVNLLTETMEVSYDEGKLGREEIEAAVEKAGYGASLIIGGVHRRSGLSGGTGQGRSGASAGAENGPQSGFPGARSGQTAGCGGESGTCGLAQAEGDGLSGEGTMRTGGRTSGTGNAQGGRDSVQKKAEKEARAMKWRLGISIGFLLPLMYVAMYHMYNEWFGLPIPG